MTSKEIEPMIRNNIHSAWDKKYCLDGAKTEPTPILLKWKEKLNRKQKAFVLKLDNIEFGASTIKK